MAANTDLPYTLGLHEIGDGLFAYLQPDGGWGWSNAGLITGGDGSLLVDTLFDLDLTRAMLDSMARVTDTRPIGTVVNTHANGDHCYGNQLVTGAEVVASAASAAEMESLPPQALHAMLQLDLGAATNDYLQASFGSFTFDGIDLPAPDRTFSGELALTVGERRIELIEVGPAHTAGDVLVHLPDDGVVYTGDILFINGTPIVWDGPFQNWIDACQRIIDMGCSTIVPGHGPLTDAAGVQRVADYLAFVMDESRQRHAAGMTSAEAAADIELGSYADWTDSERIAINVDAAYREIDPEHEPANVLEIFGRMAVLAGH